MFSRERKGFVKNVKKTETVSEITESRGIPHINFQSPNEQRVEFFNWTMGRNGFPIRKYRNTF